MQDAVVALHVGCCSCGMGDHTLLNKVPPLASSSRNRNLLVLAMAWRPT